MIHLFKSPLHAALGFSIFCLTLTHAVGEDDNLGNRWYQRLAQQIPIIVVFLGGGVVIVHQQEHLGHIIEAFFAEDDEPNEGSHGPIPVMNNGISETESTLDEPFNQERFFKIDPSQGSCLYPQVLDSHEIIRKDFVETPPLNRKGIFEIELLDLLRKYFL